MALQERAASVSYEAGAAIGQYILVKAGTADRQCVISGVGDRPLGVCLNKPQAAGVAATVQIDGIAKVVAGAAFAVGVPIGSDAQGRAISVAAGPLAIGTAITAALAVGQIIEVQLT